MGHEHGPPYVVPHYKMFDDITGIVQLEKLKTALEAKGLKDPWIRNEVWRYHPDFGTRASRAFRFFTRGMPIGAIAGALAAGAGFIMGDDDHGHGDH